MAVPIYIHSNSAQDFLFSPHSRQHLFFLVFFDNSHSDISMWFWFAFPWWLVMLSNFSPACWPSTHLLRKVSIQVLCPFLNQIVWVFWYCIICILYIFWILTPHYTYHLQISSPIWQVATSLCWLLSSLSRSFVAGQSPVCSFFFCCPYLMRQIQKNIAKTNVKEHPAYVFF